jgi:aldehyde dehydrogenase (NAD+)
MATATTTKARTIKAPQVKDQPLFIGGKFVDSASGKTFAAINPATGESICQVAEADKTDVDRAVQAARKALEQGPWRKMDAAERGRLMYKLAELVEKNAEELSAIEALNSG